jgi:hypothetical protein
MLANIRQLSGTNVPSATSQLHSADETLLRLDNFVGITAGLQHILIEKGIMRCNKISILEQRSKIKP